MQKIKNQTSKKEEKVESQTPEDEKKIENRISLKLSKAFNPCANTMDLRNILGLPSTVQSLPPIKNEDEEDGDEKCDDPLEEGRKSMSSQDFTPADRLKVEEETKKNKGMRHLLRNLDGICKEFETEKMVSKTELENWPKNEKEKADS
ncbi:MAG: hypothetical protein M1549_01385 [Candidatus Dependentiae bacterium]|nr:hypothetical protein [Candidatus Dependentiae bacterium]